MSTAEGELAFQQEILEECKAQRRHADGDTSREQEGLFRSTISGGVGGVAIVLAGHPFDTVKLRMQAASGSTSALELARFAWAQSGIRGLYRGASAPLALAIPCFASSFWGFNVSSQMINVVSHKANERRSLSTAETAIAGGLSAIPATVVLAPCERVKCLLQIQEQGAEPRRYSGALDCVRQLARSGGLPSLFRGWQATLLRDIPGAATWFATYEALKHHLTPEGGSPAIATTLCAGATAGMTHWLIVMPADCIKSRVQTNMGRSHLRILDCYRSTVADGGYRALYRGMGPILLRAAPANAACFASVEGTRKVMERVGIV